MLELKLFRSVEEQYKSLLILETRMYQKTQSINTFCQNPTAFLREKVNASPPKVSLRTSEGCGRDGDQARLSASTAA